MKRLTAGGLLLALLSWIVAPMSCGGTAGPTAETIEIPLHPEVALFMASAAPFVASSELSATTFPSTAGLTCRPGIGAITGAVSSSAPATECFLLADSSVLPRVDEGGFGEVVVSHATEAMELARIFVRRSSSPGKSVSSAPDADVYLTDSDSDGVANVVEVASGFSPFEALNTPGVADVEHAANRARERLEPFWGWFPLSPIDLTPPVATISAGNAIKGGIELLLDSSDPKAVFVCSLDGSGFEPCGRAFRLQNLTEGAHRMEVKAVGSLGNAQAIPTPFEWEQEPLEEVIPDETAPAAPEGLSIDMSDFGAGRITLSWAEPFDEGGICAYRVWYDTDGPSDPYTGAGFVEGDSPISTSFDATSMILSGLTLRPYYLAATAIDCAGNESSFSNEVTTFLPPAQYVIGQPDFAARNAGLSAATFHGPGTESVGGLAFDADAQRLFVSDYYGHRLLIFSLAGGISDGMSASSVLGVSDFGSRGSGCNSGSLLNPLSPEFDPESEYLYVPQEGANRVSVFDLGNGIRDGMSASFVLGQKDAASCVGGGGRAYLMGPTAVTRAAGIHSLFVSDRGNSRVLAWDLRSGLGDGIGASLVLGQNNFAAGNCGSDTGRLDGPYQSIYDDVTGRLFVADSGSVCGLGSRIMVFDLSGGMATGMHAASYLGQPNVTGAGVGRSSMGNPRGMAFDPIGRMLFVSDRGNHRILVFDLSMGDPGGLEASYVIGQPDFESRMSGTSSTTLRHPGGLAYDPVHQRLFVADSGNNRVLMFALPPGGTADPMKKSNASLDIPF